MRYAKCWTIPVILLPLAFADRAARGDDAKINTPVVSAQLTASWQLRPEKENEFRQWLHLGPGLSGSWQQSKETLPVGIAWFVEGHDLRILHYYEPNEPFNYRVATIMAGYELSDGGKTLRLTIDGKPTKWSRVEPPQQPASAPAR